MRPLTRAVLVELLYENITSSKAEANELVDAFFGIIASQLRNGKKVKLSGFGSFELRNKKARPGRNPRTGEEALIVARRVVTFRPSPKLRKLVEAGISNDP